MEESSEQSLSVVSKPIKKAPAFKYDEDEGDDTGQVQQISSEVKARNDLIAFLSTKKIENKTAEGYEVHLRRFKRANEVGYSVSYSAPDGSILASKNDVLGSIQETEKRQRRKFQSGSPMGMSSSSNLRKETYQNTKLSIQYLKLPEEFDDITVFCLGKRK